MEARRSQYFNENPPDVVLLELFAESVCLEPSTLGILVGTT